MCFPLHFYVLAFSESVDVNVTPDKHLLLMEGEKALLAMIKVEITCSASC